MRLALAILASAALFAVAASSNAPSGQSDPANEDHRGPADQGAIQDGFGDAHFADGGYSTSPSPSKKAAAHQSSGPSLAERRSSWLLRSANRSCGLAPPAMCE